MFEKRKCWTGWTLALAMMLSLAPQGAMAAEMTPPAVQEASGASSSAPGETVGTGVEAGSSSGQEGGTGSSGEETVQPGADPSTNGAGENTQSGADASTDSTDETVQAGTDASEDSTKENTEENVQPGTDASGNVGKNTESLTESGTDESSSEADDSTSSSESSFPAVVLETVADDGTSIKIDAPEGAFPEGIHVTVKAVEPEQILDALRTAADDPELATEDVAAYDFDFWLDDGTHQIEPKKEIAVQIGLPKLESGDTVSAWHLDSESDETAESETVTAESDSGTATITSDVFSIHAIVVRRAATEGVTIDYDENSDIHSVTEDGSKIILFCMNDGLHWPHSTPNTPDVPSYTETTIDAFCKANDVTDDTLAQKVKNVLYAGYPYNGYGLYQVVGQAVSLTEGEFNLFLDPPAYLRSDFPDSIGNNSFTYADLNDASKMELLTKFVKESMALYPSGSTSSGVSYSQLTALPFWRAAYCMVTYKDSPINAYSTLYISGSYVTESQAYKSTSNAIWTLMFNSGVPNNNEVPQDALTSKLLGAAGKKTMILEQAPSSDSLSVTGDTTFRYSSEDGKWHTSPLKLAAPSGYLTPFTLSLPDGVSEESGRTQITAGEEFSLVSASPASSSTLSLSAKVPWMDGDLRVYEPVGNTVASDGKGYQNMVGAVIKTNEISVSATLTRTDEYTDLTFTKKWEDHNNQDGLRPATTDYASKLHLMNGSTEVKDVKPTVTDNGDNTWTVSYSNLPKYAGGTVIAYSVKEDSVSGYTADAETVANNGTLTNTHTPEVTKVTFTKKWEDHNNQDGLRPATTDYASKLHLMNGSTEVKDVKPTVTDNGDNTWTVSYSNLPKYAGGTVIAYSVKEDSVSGYTADAETVANNGTLTNTHTPEVTKVTFTKKWEDHNNQDGLRPATTDYASKLHLMNGSTEVKDVKPTVTDNGDNTWTVSYSNLPKYAGGTVIAYSVKEDSVSGYTADAETVADGGTLTNTHKVKSSTTPTSETNPTNTQNVQPGTTPTSETNPTNTQKETATTTPSSETDPTESSIKTSGGAGTAANGSNTNSSGSAKTGDNSALELYGLLSALSMAALLILLGMKHRRNKA